MAPTKVDMTSFIFPATDVTTGLFVVVHQNTANVITTPRHEARAVAPQNGTLYPGKLCR
jgi:hypothetical protein